MSSEAQDDPYYPHNESLARLMVAQMRIREAISNVQESALHAPSATESMEERLERTLVSVGASLCCITESLNFPWPQVESFNLVGATTFRLIDICSRIEFGLTQSSCEDASNILRSDKAMVLLTSESTHIECALETLTEEFKQTLYPKNDAAPPKPRHLSVVK